MLAEKNPYISRAYQQLQIISQDKEKRLEYEAREKAIRDHNQLMYEAEQRGIGIGREEGREKSMEQINKLITHLIQDKRYEDLERSANDPNFQQQLIEEYQINF